MKTIQIHGKNYVPVSERIKEAGKVLVGVETEVLQHEPVVVIKAKVWLDKGTFTGISSANPAKLIEKTNPYEVAETSAVGRALGFAGYGIDEGIASADEVTKYPENDDATTIYPASQKQLDYIIKLEDQKGVDHLEIIDKNHASRRIEELLKMPADILNQVNESFAKSNGDTGIEGEYGDK